MQAYRQLEALFVKLYNYEHFIGLGDWDMQVNMPPKGSDARGEALGQLSQLRVDLITAAEVQVNIEEATAGVAELSQKQQANLREMTRAWRMEKLLPSDFVQKKVTLTTRAHKSWEKSRKENDFSIFLPELKQLVQLAREEGTYLASNSGREPYEALLDVYEPGFSLQQLDEIFNDLKTWLPKLVKDIVQTQQSRADTVIVPKGPFPQQQQEALSRHIMQIWQFDFEAGRMDVSTHPFTGMTKEDTRITTNFPEDSLEVGLYGTIHETGHARYEQNCGPKDMLNQPVCNARSLGVHESQSLFAEFQIGHSDEFVSYLTPKLTEYFGEQPAFTAGNMKAVLQRVEPGLIRIFADEVTYPLHIILRYEIERALLEGKMEAEDIPRVWNDKMKEYLGLETLGNDKMGCLQDIHWSGGMFGYFPTYSLGAMFAAQLMATIKRELGEDVVARCLNTGDLGPIFAKQKEKIWDNGCLYETNELMVKATGEPLNPKYFREHLERRYLHSM